MLDRVLAVLEWIARRLAYLFLGRYVSSPLPGEYGPAHAIMRAEGPGGRIIFSWPIQTDAHFGFHKFNCQFPQGFRWRSHNHAIEVSELGQTVRFYPRCHNLEYCDVVFVMDPQRPAMHAYSYFSSQIQHVLTDDLADDTREFVGLGGYVSAKLITRDGWMYTYLPRKDEFGNYTQFATASYDFPRKKGLTNITRARFVNDSAILVNNVNEEGARELVLLMEVGSSWDARNVPTDPAGRLRHICKTISWFIGISPQGTGMYAHLVITGNRNSIRMYYFPGTGWEYRLVRFNRPHGGLEYEYWFPTFGDASGWREWDVKIGPPHDADMMINVTQSSSPVTEISLVAPHKGGSLYFCTLTLSLNPDPDGVHYFEVKSKTIKDLRFQPGPSVGSPCGVSWIGPVHFPSLQNPFYYMDEAGVVRLRGIQMP